MVPQQIDALMSRPREVLAALAAHADDKTVAEIVWLIQSDRDVCGLVYDRTIRRCVRRVVLDQMEEDRLIAEQYGLDDPRWKAA